MPELPEVETVMQGLRSASLNARIDRALARRPDLRNPIPTDFTERLEGRTITDLRRRAKYILMDLDSENERGDTVIWHLGMSGRMRIYDVEPANFEKHDHIIVVLDSGKTLIYNDPRRFGFVDVAKTVDLAGHRSFQNLGIEPLAETFDGAYLESIFKGRRTSIKQALMDQRLVVGVGNIYACEALYEAGIHPELPAGEISLNRLERLSETVKQVLTAAIAAGGSSLRDHQQVSGELGYFQHNFKVYGRAGQPCPAPHEDQTIQRIVQSGRSTFFCPGKQASQETETPKKVS